MDGKYNEKEALTSKLNTLTSLVDALKTRNNALKKMSKLSKEVHRKRNKNNSSENGTLLKKQDTGQSSSSDSRTKISGHNQIITSGHNHNDKLNTSSERLSKLAKETWKAKKITSEHNRIDIDREKSNRTKDVHYFKEIPKISLETRRCQALLHKKSKVIRKNSSFSLGNNTKGDAKDGGMSVEKSNSISEESKGASFLSLDESSDRLSCIAKSTWRNVQKRRNFKHYVAQRNDNATSTVFTGENSYERESSNEKYKIDGSRKHRYRLNRVKDRSTFSGREKQGCNSGGTSTNERLSNLAKDIWRDKKRYTNGKLLNDLNCVDNRFPSGRGFRKNTSRPHVLSSRYKSSKWSRNGSFLHRRSTVIRKQNRFSIIKVTNSVFQNNSQQEQYKAKPIALPDTRKTYSHSRSSFFSRRQAYLYSHLQSTQKSWKISDINSIPSIYKKKLSHRPVERKAVKDAQIYFKIRGRKYQTDIKGRRLRRISSSSRALSEPGLNFGDAAVLRPSKSLSTPNNCNRYKFVKRQSSVANNMTKVIASRVVKKSVARLQQNKMRKLVKKQYCMFYNRFGKCKNGTKCPYKHDPEKIAVCTRFLRGTCKEKNCLFSHKIDRRKMPTCSFFLRGMCHKDDCPYAHVKVNINADICKDFIKGHCPNGDKCFKKHVLECSSFMETGKCPDRENCKFYHPKSIKRRRTRSLSGTRAPFPFLKRTRVLDAKNDAEGLEDISKDSALQIRPTFAATHQSPDKSESSSPSSRRKRKFDWKKDSEQQNTTNKLIISE